MKRTITNLLCFLVIVLTNFGHSQYSFSSFDQSIYINGDPSMTNVNTLSTCTEYVFDYSITFNPSGSSPVNDDITIDLPLNVSFQSLVSPPSAVTLNSSSGNSVSLHLSGWNISNVLKIKMIGVSSSCDASTVTGNPLAQLSGTLASASVASTNGITIVSPQLVVQDISLSSLNNIGDVDEIVFKIQNTGPNGTVIQNLLVDYSLNSIIESYQNKYYLSSSSAQGTGNTIYTYTFPGGVFPTTLPANTITIDPTDFQTILGHNYLANNEIIYLHIPYKVDLCGASNGSFTFKRDCGNSLNCDVIPFSHNISVVSSSPSGSAIQLVDENASFCATASTQEMDMGWRFINSNANPTGGPSGYGRATDLQLLFFFNNSFGTANLNSFTISNGTNSVDISSVVEMIDPAFAFNTSITGTVYKINLDQLDVVSGDWQPLGPNSLSDLDGDGKLDDIIEGGSFDIHVDYTYNTSCPLDQETGSYYLISSLEWYFKNACGVPYGGSAANGNFTPNASSSNYRYTATGAGGELTVPPDVIAGEPFTSELCFAPYEETYNFNDFEFECPNGFHRVIYEVPNGYHLNTSGFTASSSHPGWFELPDMTVTSFAGPNHPTAQVSPIAKEYCNPNGLGRIIEVRFGMIPTDMVSNGIAYTMQLPCLELPMYLNCDAIDPSCPALPNNFGFDNLNFRLEFVCDETCSTCSSYIVGGHASTYHHCMGLCESYFGTDSHPVFKRSTLGYENTASGYISGDDLTQPSDLTTATEPTINLSAAYPGDQIELKVNGSFHPVPASSYTPHTGASYSDIFLQIRYDDLPAGERKEARLFDLEQVIGDEIVITKTLPLGGGTTTYPIAVSALTMTSSVSAIGSPYVVSLNIHFPQAALNFINDATAQYTFASNLHLRVRSEPTSPTVHTFFSYGQHVLTSLRFEYKGIESDEVTINGSCDDYGANFKILQPNSFGRDGLYIGEATYCGLTSVNFRFFNDAALYNIANDFPNEYRAYGQMDPLLDITIPSGYTFVNAHFQQDGKQFNPGNPNNFGTNYLTSPINIPISIGTPPTTLGGNTIIHFNGIDGNGAAWPSIDLEVMTGSQYIVLDLLPTCEVPVHSMMYANGSYTLNVNQDLPAYQYNFPFESQMELGHYAPHVNTINPTAAVNAYNGTAEFNFSLCNEDLFMTGTANNVWFAFENSAVNGLDLTNATLINIQTNQPVPFTTYTDPLGNQGIIINFGAIAQQVCVDFKLTALVSPNGCVDTNVAVPDYLTVYGGNSCDGSILIQPSAACTSETTQFTFNRYPSDLELILPEDAYPTDDIEMCNGILEYNFILNSYEIGGVDDVDFWVDLPTGLSLYSVSFTNPLGVPSATYTTSVYDDNTFGAGGNLSGWHASDDLGLNYLPGSLNSPNNQILVHLEVQSSCDYDLSSPVLCYANSVNSCGQETNLLEMNSLPAPLISNATLANELVITPTITFSDEHDTLNCFNEATVTLTITNNSNVSNLTAFNVKAQVPGSPLIVDPGTGTLTGNEITWPVSVGSIPGNSSTTVYYSLTNPGVICQNDVPMSASIQFSQDVNCTSIGGSCNVELTTDTVYFDIDVCCNCEVKTTQFHIASAYCYGSVIDTLPEISINGVTGTWSPAVISNITSGTYVFTPDTGQCATSYTLNVTINPLPTVTVNSTSICPGESATLTAGGASSYTWTPSATLSSPSGATVTATPTSTTTYTVTGTNEFGCSSNASSTVTVNPLITPTFKMMDTYCVGSTPDALPNPSLNNISGTWSPSTINTSTVGDFVYTFTPNTGQCAATVTVTIHIVAPTIPTFSLANTFCAGASVPTLLSPSDNGINGSWSPTAISNTTSGTYVFTPTAGQCATTYTLHVTINPNPVPTISHGDGSLTICSGSSIMLTSSSTTGNTWSTGATTQTITVTTAGTYTVTVNNGNGCTATSAPVTVTVNPVPLMPTISCSSPVCIGGSFTLMANTISGATYYWAGPSGYTSNAQNPVRTSATSAMAGTYTCYVVVNGCLSPQASVNVVVNPIPVMTQPSNITACSGNAVSAITFTTSPVISGTTYTWNNTNTSIGLLANGSGNISSYTAPVVSSSTAGTITVTPDVNGCQGTSKTFTITINPKPVLSSQSNITVCPGTVVPATSFTSTPSGATLNWTNGNTSIGLGNTGAGNVPSFTATNSSGSAILGNVSVNPLLNGCLGNTVSYSITVNPKPTITGTQTVCVGATTQLTGGGTPASISPWLSSVPGTATVSSTGLVTAVAAGTTIITYTNSLGCQNTALITVNPKPVTPTISADGPITFCYGSSVTLTSSSATNNLWSTGATTQDIVVSTAGTYNVTVSNAYGCTNTSIGVMVNVTTATMAQPSNITVCPGTSVTVPSFSGATTYNWSRTAASIGLTPTSGTTPTTPIPTFMATNSGGTAISSTFTVTPVTTGGCGGPAKQFTITVNPRPAAPTISGPTTICSGETATLTSTTYTSDIVWSPGGATTTSIVVPAPTPASTATYTLTYTAANGCQNSTSVTVTKVTCSKPLKCVVSANLSVGVVSACERSFTNMSTVGSIPLTSSNTGYAYQWTISNSNTNALLTSGTGFNLPNFTFSATGTYRVCLRVARIAVPECYDEYCVEISVNCSSSLVLSTHTNGLTSRFGVKDSEKETLQNVDYLWDFGDGSFSTEENPIHTYTSAGSYKVCLKIGNGDLAAAPILLCRTIDVSGDLTESGIVPVLSVNPNPTSGQTTVLLDGAEGKTVEIKLFNMLGEEVTTLFSKTCCNDEMIRLIWNSEEVPPGVYLVKAQVDSKTMVEKIVVSSH